MAWDVSWIRVELWVNLFTMQIKQRQTDWRACGYQSLRVFSKFSLLWFRPKYNCIENRGKSFNPPTTAPKPLNQIRPLVLSQTLWAPNTHKQGFVTQPRPKNLYTGSTLTLLEMIYFFSEKLGSPENLLNELYVFQQTLLETIGYSSLKIKIVGMANMYSADLGSICKYNRSFFC